MSKFEPFGDMSVITGSPKFQEGPCVMSWSSKSMHHPIPAAEVPENRHSTNGLHDFVTRHAEAFAAALALGDRTRARAEIYRITNNTKDRNDFDSDAEIIDTIVALAASRHHNVGREPSTSSGGAAPKSDVGPIADTSHGSAEGQNSASTEVDETLASSQERRRRRLMGSGENAITNDLQENPSADDQPRKLAVTA
jgi:hypothetical protein